MTYARNSSLGHMPLGQGIGIPINRNRNKNIGILMKLTKLNQTLSYTKTCTFTLSLILLQESFHCLNEFLSFSITLMVMRGSTKVTNILTA